MTMNITSGYDMMSFHELFQMLLGVENSWMVDSMWIVPSSIQVTSTQRSSIISIDHTIFHKLLHMIYSKT